MLKLTPQSQYGIQPILPLNRRRNFEVDSTESVWYTLYLTLWEESSILKLTPQSQYGIRTLLLAAAVRLFWSWLHRVSMVYEEATRCMRLLDFEVDSTESVWYNFYLFHPLAQKILKLTPQSQYGIMIWPTSWADMSFWSWLHRVSMVYRVWQIVGASSHFEVDSTESVWYTKERKETKTMKFWSWLHRVSMV